LTHDSTNFDLVAADCNFSESVDLADVVALIDYILYGAW